MIQLKFNSEEMFNDIIRFVLLPSADEALDIVKESIWRATKSSSLTPKQKEQLSNSDVELENTMIDMAKSKITKACVSYGWVILTSYGSGPKLDFPNEDFLDYKFSDLWNRRRPKQGTGYKIVGRTKGPYINFFGEDVKSNGNRAGKGIGGWGVGISPTYAIQNAEKKLQQGVEPGGFVNRIIESKMQEFLETVDLDKYFIEVNT